MEMNCTGKADVDVAFASTHCVEVLSAANTSKVHAAFISRVEASGVSSYIYRFWSERPTGEMVRAGALSVPTWTLDTEMLTKTLLRSTLCKKNTV
jgi:hypothetical protein